jgi:hypothetical protein
MKRYTDILNEQVTPKVETPKAETPKVETPKTESPKSEENKSETKSVITIIENIKKSIDFEKEKIKGDFNKSKMDTKYNEGDDIFWYKDKKKISGTVKKDEGEQVNVIVDNSKTATIIKKANIVEKIKKQKLTEQKPVQPAQNQNVQQKPVQNVQKTEQPVQKTT